MQARVISTSFGSFTPEDSFICPPIGIEAVCDLRWEVKLAGVSVAANAEA